MTAPASQFEAYGPVADDLPRVDELLDSLRDVEFPWLREMLGAVLGGGGKRLRPALTLLAGRLRRNDHAQRVT